MLHRIRKADDRDVEEMAVLINRAYEPAENFLYEGPRVSVGEVREKLCRDAFLMAVGPQLETLGVVHVECCGALGRFGLLAVAPEHRGTRVGEALVEAAERVFLDAGCHTVEIEVVNHRRSLTSYYGKLGYAVTGERPFDFDRLRIPSRFLILHKSLHASN